MRSNPHHKALPAHPSGFSLIELSVVMVILSIVSVLGLESVANFVTRSAGTLTKERLATIDDALVRFFRIYGRLPCPAVISTAPGSNTYGVEDCVTIGTLSGTTIGGGVLSGAVPFRTLNLPMSNSLDGFNNKINYAVTKNLTAAGGDGTLNNRFGSYGGTSAQDGLGGIEVRSGILEQPCNSSKCQVIANPNTNASATAEYVFGYPPSSPSFYVSKTPGAAYFVFSNGADKRGSYSSRGTAQSACIQSAASYGQRIDSQNCLRGSGTVVSGTALNIPYNVFYDSRYNAGLNLTSYFDDYVVWRTKAQL